MSIHSFRDAPHTNNSSQTYINTYCMSIFLVAFHVFPPTLTHYKKKRGCVFLLHIYILILALLARPMGGRPRNTCTKKKRWHPWHQYLLKEFPPSSIVQSHALVHDIENGKRIHHCTFQSKFFFFCCCIMTMHRSLFTGPYFQDASWFLAVPPGLCLTATEITIWWERSRAVSLEVHCDSKFY